MSPESSYEKHDQKVSMITTYDGHFTSAQSIQQAVNDGMKFFYDVEDNSGCFILCSKVSLTQKEIDRYLGK